MNKRRTSDELYRASRTARDLEAIASGTRSGSRGGSRTVSSDTSSRGLFVASGGRTSKNAPLSLEAIDERADLIDLQLRRA